MGHRSGFGCRRRTSPHLEQPSNEQRDVERLVARCKTRILHIFNRVEALYLISKAAYDQYTTTLKSGILFKTWYLDKNVNASRIGGM